MPERYILFDHGPEGGPQGFANPDQMIVAWDAGDVETALNKAQSAHSAGKWLAGFISYELGYVLEPKLASLLPLNRKTPLICFGVFSDISVSAAQKLISQDSSIRKYPTLNALNPLWLEQDYAKAFQIAKDYICAGDFYQINLTFPMQTYFKGKPLDLYASFYQKEPAKYGAIAHLGEGPVVISRSPELFFQISADRIIETRPMKGTLPRGKTKAKDKALVAFLEDDPKNRAENLMIVDLLRNDVSRIAQIGSVTVPELFTIETYKTVHQMTSLIRAELRENVTISDLFRALFPCGSVTGAPKIRAMEAICELEPTPRDVYCGSIGWIAPDGSASFNVAIRTLSVFDTGEVTLNVGGGVVYDSSAPSEYEEALWKARFAELA